QVLDDGLRLGHEEVAVGQPRHPRGHALLLVGRRQPLALLDHDARGGELEALLAQRHPDAEVERVAEEGVDEQRERDRAHLVATGPRTMAATRTPAAAA